MWLLACFFILEFLLDDSTWSHSELAVKHLRAVFCGILCPYCLALLAQCSVTTYKVAPLHWSYERLCTRAKLCHKKAGYSRGLWESRSTPEFFKNELRELWLVCFLHTTLQTKQVDFILLSAIIRLYRILAEKGTVVCMRPELSALNADNYIVPIWMI